MIFRSIYVIININGLTNYYLVGTFFAYLELHLLDSFNCEVKMKHVHTVALFGEAEKGQFRRAYYCNSLPQLVDSLGNPPLESQGLFFAVQALLYDRSLIFFRVEEEGYSYQDYFSGLRALEEQNLITDISAICLPGVGDVEIIDAVVPLCKIYKSILILTEPDLYDYLTEYREGTYG